MRRQNALEPAPILDVSTSGLGSERAVRPTVASRPTDSAAAGDPSEPATPGGSAARAGPMVRQAFGRRAHFRGEWWELVPGIPKMGRFLARNRPVRRKSGRTWHGNRATIGQGVRTVRRHQFRVISKSTGPTRRQLPTGRCECGARLTIQPTADAWQFLANCPDCGPAVVSWSRQAPPPVFASSGGADGR